MRAIGLPFCRKSLRSCQIAICLIAVLCVSLGIMAQYTQGPLDGQFDKYLMTAKHWGMPQDLAKRGVPFLYLDRANLGWDGQFYYYVANDPFALKDTAAHIDADAYRYQRIGLPLMAKVASLLFFQDWVSPRTYYLTNLFLILLGTLFAARHFAASGTNPLWALLWALSVGPQITLLNGLPDGAADALLIIALISGHRKNYLLYALAASLACLTREAYVLFPAAYFAITVLTHWLRKRAASLLLYIYLCAPLVVFGGWRLFLKLRFVQSPFEQGGGFVGYPFVSLAKHMALGLEGRYPGTPIGHHSYMAGIGLVLFSLLLIYAVYLAVRISLSYIRKDESAYPVSVSAFIVATCALYFCFGDGVIWNFTGYMKAGSFFIFFIPFCWTLGVRQSRIAVFVLLVVVTAFFGHLGLELRVHQPPIRFSIDTNCGRAEFDGIDTQCYEKFVWKGRALRALRGTVLGERRVGVASRDKAGILTFGPHITLPAAIYRVTLVYSSDSDDALSVDVTGDAGKRQIVAKTPLLKGDNRVFTDRISVESEPITLFEVRTWLNSGTASVSSLSIERIQAAPSTKPER